MINERHILLELLKAALWGGHLPDIPEDTDWRTVLKIASEQTVSGLVAEAVGRLPEELRPDPQSMRQLQMFMVRNMQAHSLLNSRFAEVDALLRKNGIVPVLLKGQGLAAEYPDPLLRQCGDIDLYVGTDDYQRSVEILCAAYGRSDKDSESIKHYHMKYDGVSIEIHRIAGTIPGLVRGRRFNRWTADCLRRPHLRNVSLNGYIAAVPPVDFNIVFVMIHAWHHFLNGGVGLRQLCDWIILLHNHRDGIDHVRLEKMLKRLGLLGVWQMFGCIAVNRLGLPLEECPLYSDKHQAQADIMLDFIFDEGNFGKYDIHRTTPRPSGYAAGKLHSFVNNAKRYVRIFRVYPAKAIESSIHYTFSGIFHFFKGLR